MQHRPVLGLTSERGDLGRFHPFFLCKPLRDWVELLQ